jgi:hypothetical protein
MRENDETNSCSNSISNLDLKLNLVKIILK